MKFILNKIYFVLLQIQINITENDHNISFLIIYESTSEFSAKWKLNRSSLRAENEQVHRLQYLKK